MEQLNLHTATITQMEILKKDKVILVSSSHREGHKINTVPSRFVSFAGVYQQSYVKLLPDFIEPLTP